MKQYHITELLTMAMILLFIACERDHLYDGAEGSDLTFELSLSSQTKASDDRDTLFYRARGNTEYMLCSFKEDMENNLNTKAAAVTVVPDSVKLFSYRYVNWGDKVCPAYEAGMLLHRDGSVWKTEDQLLFDISDPLCKMRHFAIAPYDVESMSMLETSGGPSFTYTVPDDITMQKDILFGVSEETGADQRRVNIVFSHLLTSVSFAVDSECSDSYVNYVKLKNIYKTAHFSPDSSWTDYSGAGSLTLYAGKNVVNGEESMISDNESTMMLLPQVLPDDALLQICLSVDGEDVVLETGIGGQIWDMGSSYVYKLHFEVDQYDSFITYTVDMNHKITYVVKDTYCCLPVMTFEKGTEKIKVDWGDGTEEVYTSKPKGGYVHSFPSNYVGDVSVSIKGTSPWFSRNETTTQRIRKIKIRNNERYDSREDCNCIIETDMNALVYAGIDYKIPESVTVLYSYSMLAVEDKVVKLPEGIKTLKYSAFYGSSSYVTEIVLPASLTKIEDGSIMSYNYLKKISVNPNNPVYDSRNNCNCVMETASDYVVATSKSSVIPTDTKGIKPYGCTVTPANIELPQSCLEIGRCAFYSNNRLKYINIPAGCHVMNEAFSVTNPEKIDYSAGNITLEPSAFAYSSGIDSLKLDRFTSIGASSFRAFKGLVDIDIPEGYVLPREVFFSCPDLGYVKIPANCVLYKGVFRSCPALRRVDLYATPKEYSDSYCFAYCDKLIQLNVYDGCIKLNENDIYGSPINLINWYSTKSPQFTQLNVSQDSGQIHTLSSCDFSAWFIQTNLYNKGWTITNDL